MGAPASTPGCRLPALLLVTLLPATALAATDVPPPPDARELGRPPEALSPRAARDVGRALVDRGLIADPAAPLALREGLIDAQERADLAPTGWLDGDTARALGLYPSRVLPVAAGAGSMRTAGATAGGGEVGGPPGPASPPPSAAELGMPATGPGDAAFHLAEARRLAAAAASLRIRAGASVVPAPLLAQARKADLAAALHEERYRDAGGAAALAGLAP
jgi:hypothetical protein